MFSSPVMISLSVFKLLIFHFSPPVMISLSVFKLLIFHFSLYVTLFCNSFLCFCKLFASFIVSVDSIILNKHSGAIAEFRSIF
jgi:hypothetical protein